MKDKGSRINNQGKQTYRDGDASSRDLPFKRLKLDSGFRQTVNFFSGNLAFTPLALAADEFSLCIATTEEWYTSGLLDAIVLLVLPIIKQSITIINAFVANGGYVLRKMADWNC